MAESPTYHIILLPRENYWGWVAAVRDYVVHFGVSVTPMPGNAVRFHQPNQVVSVVNFPGAYPGQGDIVAWFQANAASVPLDVINVNSPDSLRTVLEQRVRTRLRFGVDVKPPEPAAPETKPRFFLRWPTDYPQITQDFGVNPDVYRRWNLPGHEGIDFRAPMNSSVYACADGEVYQVHDGSGEHPYGIHVRIRHADGFKTVYAHLNRATVYSGKAVKAGEQIGLADSTGNSSGSHLHLTLKKDGATAAGLTMYPYDIIDPTPFLIQPETTPPPDVRVPEWRYRRCLVGVHGRADGPMQASDWIPVQIARVEAIKFTSSAAPEDIDRALSIEPELFIMVRLFADFRNRVVRASEFARWVEPDMRRFYDRGVRYYEIHNEPNLMPEGYGVSWRDGHGFGEWFLEVVGWLKPKFPEARFGWPGLSPGPTIEGMRFDHQLFLDSAARLVDQADWIGCHCYWQDEAGMFSRTEGLGYQYYRERWPDKLVFITEFSNNSPRVSLDIKGQQYLKYYRHLHDQVGLGAAFAFVVSASANFPHEVWRFEDGQMTPIPAIIGGRTF